MCHYDDQTCTNSCTVRLIIQSIMCPSETNWDLQYESSISVQIYSIQFTPILNNLSNNANKEFCKTISSLNLILVSTLTCKSLITLKRLLVDTGHNVSVITAKPESQLVLLSIWIHCFTVFALIKSTLITKVIWSLKQIPDPPYGFRFASLLLLVPYELMYLEICLATWLNHLRWTTLIFSSVCYLLTLCQI